jgi:glycosyltransferase involved in cell wall biosynthesis
MTSRLANVVDRVGGGPRIRRFVSSAPAPRRAHADSTRPTISVITISYNQASFVGQTIYSLANQDYQAVEHILLDGGSTDGTLAVLEANSGLLSRWDSRPDDGPADALNRGFDMASGEILGYVNSDDILLPGALATVAREFEAAPEVDVIFGDAVLLDANTRVLRPLCSDDWSTSEFVKGRVVIVQPAMFIRRRALPHTPVFNVANRSCWDGELVAQLAHSGAVFRHIHGKLAGFRVHGGSISGSKRLESIYVADRREIARKYFAEGGLTAADERPRARVLATRVRAFGRRAYGYMSGVLSTGTWRRAV